MSCLYKTTLHFLAITSLLWVLTGCGNNEKQTGDEVAGKDYAELILDKRAKKDAELVDTTVSRFNAEERAHFSEKGLQYYPPDISYRVTADFTLDTTRPVFQMETTTDRRPNYRVYGYLNFTLKDTLCRLTAYQNYDYRDHPEYGKLLFVPFRDKTNEFGTYGGGRYIDIEIPDSNKVILDFNEAYNPYCAYSHRWSCALVPQENTLDVAVFAGEKSYK